MANARAESAGGFPDTLKWVLSVGLLGAAIVGFYVYAEQSLLLRVVVLLAVAAISVAIAYQTEKGRLAWGFLRDARTEVRKVVWPTRRETGQTTLIVIVVVALVALILWVFDGLLTYLVRLLLGTGG
jgi:preprotein translocase subunit SecE